jgi:hypothetical protein
VAANSRFRSVQFLEHCRHPRELERERMTEVPGNNATKNTKFKPGNPHRFPPGNPGRPKGSKHKTTLIAEKLMQDDAREIVKSVIAAAKKGDMTACKIVLDRIAPIRKGRPIRVDLPEAHTAGDVAAALAAVVTAMAAGELTPDEASMVASVLEVRRKSIETVELENRLRTVERKAGDHGDNI